MDHAITKSRQKCRLRVQILAILLAGAACNPRPTAPGPRQPHEIERVRGSSELEQLEGTRPFFVPGEFHVWNYSFLGVTVGRTRVSVGKPIDHEGKTLIDVSWQSELVGIASQFMTAEISSRSWINAETGVSMSTSYEGDMKMGVKFGKNKGKGKGKEMHARQIITRDDKTGRLRIQTWGDGHKPTDTTRPVPVPNKFDPASAFLVLRGWDAPIGGRATMRIGLVGGGGNYELIVEGRELLHSALGRMPTVRIAGFKIRKRSGGRTKTSKRVFTLWISNDKKRLPLRMVFHLGRGDFVVEAVRYLVNGRKPR